jgi:hydroxymethylbilane synthase
MKIGTRGSPLALAQAHETALRLGVPCEIVVIQTTGDLVQDKPLSMLGGKGLFTKEIEEALLKGEIDLAVHSAKDMPTELPSGLVLSAFLEREDTSDLFLSPHKLADLPQNAVIGTASLRRASQMKAFRADLVCVNFRGNVQTRLRKLNEGQVAGTILAKAGLNRLNMEIEGEILPFLPALGQGAIAIETTVDKAHLVSSLNHRETEIELLFERAFLRALNGSCRMPIAGRAIVSGDIIRFKGEVLSLDGSKRFETSIECLTSKAESEGFKAGRALLSRLPQGLLDV